MNKNQSLGIYIIAGIIIFLFLVYALAGPTTVTNDLTYSQFLTKVEAGEIKSAEIGKGVLIAVPKNTAVKVWLWWVKSSSP